MGALFFKYGGSVIQNNLNLNPNIIHGAWLEKPYRFNHVHRSYECKLQVKSNDTSITPDNEFADNNKWYINGESFIPSLMVFWMMVLSLSNNDLTNENSCSTRFERLD